MKTTAKEIISINNLLRLADFHKTNLSIVKEELSKLTKEIDESLRVKYTGWVVLLKYDENNREWSSVACINPNDEKWQEMDLPDYTIMVPIPNPDTIIEFDGF